VSDASAPVTRLTTRPHAVPDPEPEADPERTMEAVPEPPPPATPADEAREHVLEIASALPRRPGSGGPRRVVEPVPPPERPEPPEPPPDDAA
jgi:hypothetical protein